MKRSNLLLFAVAGVAAYLFMKHKAANANVAPALPAPSGASGTGATAASAQADLAFQNMLAASCYDPSLVSGQTTYDPTVLGLTQQGASGTW